MMLIGKITLKGRIDILQCYKDNKVAGVKLISDWGFRDDVPYGNWRKDQKAWMNKDYTTSIL